MNVDALAVELVCNTLTSIDRGDLRGFLSDHEQVHSLTNEKQLELLDRLGVAVRELVDRCVASLVSRTTADFQEQGLLFYEG